MHVLSLGAWEDVGILKQHWTEVARDLDEDAGVLMTDGSDFPKQGKESVGVKRQYCGQLEKRVNCQARVFVRYASRQGDTLLERRLYLPEEWRTDAAFLERWLAYGMPAERTFRTMPELGLELIQVVVVEEKWRCRWVTADRARGRDMVFLDSVAAYGVWYSAEDAHDTGIYLEHPATGVPQWVSRGRQPT